MFFYRVGGALLQSEAQLLSLLEADEGEAPQTKSELLVTLRVGEGLCEEPRRWLYTDRYPDTSKPFRAVGVPEHAGANRYLVRLFEYADFLLDGDTLTVVATLAPGANPRVIEPLFLEQALPLFWSLAGRPCLHASAVVWGDGAADDPTRPPRAVAFAGKSRSGKSTLATCLLAEGSELLSDDCLVMDVTERSVLAHPGHSAVRLLSDSAQALFSSPTAGEPSADGKKRRLDMSARAPQLAGAVQLARVYLLEPLGAEQAHPQISRLRPRDAVAHLAAHLFRIDPDDHARLPGELDLLLRIASSTVVARLGAPRRFDALGAVREAIAADLGAR